MATIVLNIKVTVCEKHGVVCVVLCLVFSIYPGVCVCVVTKGP